MSCKLRSVGRRSGLLLASLGVYAAELRGRPEAWLRF